MPEPRQSMRWPAWRRTTLQCCRSALRTVHGRLCHPVTTLAASLVQLADRGGVATVLCILSCACTFNARQLLYCLATKLAPRACTHVLRVYTASEGGNVGVRCKLRCTRCKGEHLLLSLQGIFLGWRWAGCGTWAAVSRHSSS